MYPPAISKITDTLYLSSHVAITEERLLDLGITHIINVTQVKPNVPFSRLPRLEYSRVPIRDVEESDILSHFDACVQKITDAEKSRGKTLVHCALGLSRSAAVCLAYMVKEKGMSLADAFRHVKSCRPYIHPNTGFWKQLILYEEQVHGKGTASVHMVPVQDILMPNVMLD